MQEDPHRPAFAAIGSDPQVTGSGWCGHLGSNEGDRGRITGVILLAVGVWGKLTLGTYISLIAENSTNAPYVLIGTGTTIIVFGLFGCFATCRGSPWMLKLYAMFLSLVFLAELVAGISGFVFRHEIKDTFLRTYTEAIQNYNKNDERSHAVDNVQESLSCCGIQSYTNWSTSPYFFKHGIPTSCCMNSSDCNTQDLRNMTVAATKVNQKGCYDLVTSFMETNMGIIAGVAFGIAFSQAILILLEWSYLNGRTLDTLLQPRLWLDYCYRTLSSYSSSSSRQPEGYKAYF
ncbi:Tetraspanin-7 [Pitangus sulphuratus]|nr:Tetraspanin-7 [Pitangus sulphuratus]